MRVDQRAKPTAVSQLWKPQYLRLVLVGVLGVALIVLGGALRTPGQADSGLPKDATLEKYESEIAREIERVVGSIKGAGRVNAAVTLDSGPLSVFAVNIQRSRNSQSDTNSGETRESVSDTESSQPVVIRSGSGDSLPVERIARAAVAGCVVVAQGASSSQVKMEIYRAVQTLLNVPLYKIHVVPMEGGK